MLPFQRELLGSHDGGYPTSPGLCEERERDQGLQDASNHCCSEQRQVHLPGVGKLLASNVHPCSANHGEGETRSSGDTDPLSKASTGEDIRRKRRCNHSDGAQDFKPRNESDQTEGNRLNPAKASTQQGLSTRGRLEAPCLEERESDEARDRQCGDGKNNVEEHGEPF